MTSPNDAVIYHIISLADWEAARQRGSYRAASLSSEGFIHFSTRRQVPRTLAKFYAGRSGLALLCVEVARLKSELRYEEADGQMFPHLYGPLNLDAVVEALPIEPGSSDPFSGRQE
ncbi:uncharacterized protein conserved in bacteria [Longilinea arvoryzae]|uniref:Uncharacterized protein conserved in bacteria n=1 Tax=Longilinea arvoryzae TaxID=360412 RepID=A0A0S7BJQ3_9CHLR|nr:DUF952 domain-containing protein [Longilinea arvoryzae]GAP14418.1 uncharacterized protein conserved in bacteria [Longilinea arvoryzae]